MSKATVKEMAMLGALNSAEYTLIQGEAAISLNEHFCQSYEYYIIPTNQLGKETTELWGSSGFNTADFAYRVI
jgi:hypothetical protein